MSYDKASGRKGNIIHIRFDAVTVIYGQEEGDRGHGIYIVIFSTLNKAMLGAFGVIAGISNVIIGRNEGKLYPETPHSGVVGYRQIMTVPDFVADATCRCVKVRLYNYTIGLSD